MERVRNKVSTGVIMNTVDFGRNRWSRRGKVRYGSSDKETSVNTRSVLVSFDRRESFLVVSQIWLYHLFLTSTNFCKILEAPTGPSSFFQGFRSSSEKDKVPVFMS